MQLNAEMNTQMTERFNVSGALLVKLFGDQRREVDEFCAKPRGVRNAGVRSAMYGRVFFVALGLVARGRHGRHLRRRRRVVVSGAITTGTLVALGDAHGPGVRPLTGLTNARVDLMTSLVSFDRVFEVLDARRDGRQAGSHRARRPRGG